MIVASPQDLPEKTLIVANLQVYVHDKEKDKDSQTERNFHCCCEFQAPKNEDLTPSGDHNLELVHYFVEV